jgi:hypothetical protein
MSRSSSPRIKDYPRIHWAKENDIGLVAWLSKGAGYTIIGAVIAFIATLSATVLPIHFSGDSEFNVYISPINIEADYLNQEISPSTLRILNPPIYENESQSIKPAIVKIRNSHE